MLVRGEAPLHTQTNKKRGIHFGFWKSKQHRFEKAFPDPCCERNSTQLKATHPPSRWRSLEWATYPFQYLQVLPQ